MTEGKLQLLRKNAEPPQVLAFCHGFLGTRLGGLCGALGVCCIPLRAVTFSKGIWSSWSDLNQVP